MRLPNARYPQENLVHLISHPIVHSERAVTCKAKNSTKLRTVLARGLGALKTRLFTPTVTFFSVGKRLFH
jgi:hypothetical protein